MLIQITMPHFCAASVVEDGRVIKAAPILRWTVGKTVVGVKRYYAKKKARWEIVK